MFDAAGSNTLGGDAGPVNFAFTTGRRGVRTARGGETFKRNAVVIAGAAGAGALLVAAGARPTQVRAAPVEGNGIRETARLAGVRKPTILWFIEDPGAVCARWQNQHAPDAPREPPRAGSGGPPRE